MSEHVSRVNQRTDFIKVDDKPHERYFDCGVPVLISTAVGNVVEKNVYAYTIECPECGTDGKYDHESEAVCPDCGLLLCDSEDLDMTTTNGQEIIADEVAAGRTNTPSKSEAN